jgi:uncharacterized C2H2 Zn-finger protein
VPKKIESPLYSGLPAKLYFHCYINPQTGYSLGKTIYGFPRTDKIYKSLKRFHNYFEKTQDGYKSKAKPLINEIKKRLERELIQLTKKEENLLSELINSEEFKQYALSYTIHQPKMSYKFSDDTDSVEEIPEEFNAFDMLTEPIGIVCTSAYVNIKFKNQPLSLDEEKHEKILKTHDFDNWRTYLDGIREYNRLVPYLNKFSKELFLKLSKLWYPAKTMILSEYVDYYNSSTEIECPKCGYKIKRRKTK